MTETTDKPTKPAAVAKGRAPEVEKAAAVARDAALAKVRDRASAPAPTPTSPPAAPAPAPKKDA